MRNLRLIAWQAFRQHVLQRSFVLSTLAIPVLVALVAAFIHTPEESPADPLRALRKPVGTVGFVDQADLVHTIPTDLPEGVVVPYPDVTAARAALEAGAIAAYYVIPPAYRETGELERVSAALPLAAADAEAFEWLLVSNCFPARSRQEIARLYWPFEGELAYRSLGSDRTDSGPLSATVPLMVAMMTMVPIFASGSLLFQSLVEEREKRVLEMLLSSVTPHDLLTGKMVGLGAVAPVKYTVWSSVGMVAACAVGLRARGMRSAFQLSTAELRLIIPYLVGCLLLYAGVMAGLGPLVPDAESSRATIFLVALPMTLPIYLISIISGAPNAPLATVLSLFPFSAPITMVIRMTSTTVPAWQVGLSLGLLFITAFGVLHLMARLFKAQTLLKGEALSLRRFVVAVVKG